ncbi:MAG: hypothetical protein V1709_02300 [Planctomycetota bacterium]
MIKQVFIILLYLLDYAAGRAFYITSYLIGKYKISHEGYPSLLRSYGIA